MIVRTRFAQQLAAAGVKLPLSLSEEFPGSVCDAAGEQIFVIDVWNELPDVDVQAVGKLLVAAINSTGGHILTTAINADCGHGEETGQ